MKWTSLFLTTGLTAFGSAVINLATAGKMNVGSWAVVAAVAVVSVVGARTADRTESAAQIAATESSAPSVVDGAPSAANAVPQSDPAHPPNVFRPSPDRTDSTERPDRWGGPGGSSTVYRSQSAASDPLTAQPKAANVYGSEHIDGPTAWQPLAHANPPPATPQLRPEYHADAQPASTDAEAPMSSVFIAGLIATGAVILWLMYLMVTAYNDGHFAKGLLWTVLMFAPGSAFIAVTYPTFRRLIDVRRAGGTVTGGFGRR
jgi:hypothetical protein